MAEITIPEEFEDFVKRGHDVNGDPLVRNDRTVPDWCKNDDVTCNGGVVVDNDSDECDSDNTTDVCVVNASGRTNQNQKIYKIGKTVAMVFAPATMALFLELIGPTLPDLMQQTQSNYEEISRILVARSVGILLGSLFGGIMTDTFSNIPELFMSLSLLVGAVGTSFVPWMTALELLGLMFFTQGLSFGFLDVCNNHLCMRMWQGKASSPIHALHFGYGMGALIAPQLARPFVSTLSQGHKQFESSNHPTAAINSTYANTTTGDFTSLQVDSSDITIPYLTSAAIALTFGIVFCMFHVYEKYINTERSVSVISQNISREETQIERKRERKLSMILNPATCTGGDTTFGVVFFFGAFFLFFNTVGGEHGYTKFLFTFAREGPLDMDSDAAAMINTLFWLCFMGGRGVAIFISKWFHPRTMLVTQLSFVLISGMALSVWGATVPEVFWVFTGLFATFLGPVLPAGISWCNRYVLMKGTAVAVVFLATGMGSMFYQWLTGYLFQYHGAHSVLYVVLGFSSFLSINFAILLIVVRTRPERYEHHVVTTKVNTNGQIAVAVETGDDASPLNDTKS